MLLHITHSSLLRGVRRTSAIGWHRPRLYLRASSTHCEDKGTTHFLSKLHPNPLKRFAAGILTLLLAGPMIVRPVFNEQFSACMAAASTSLNLMPEVTPALQSA